MQNYSRRDFCGLLAAGAAGSVLWSNLAAAASDGAAPKRNVLFLAVDDLRPQLGCYSDSLVRSPNIDRLASQGVLFRRAYCQQAVCAPSRASILSGCRPDTTGIHGLHTPLREAMPDVLTLPEHFRKNGYETISIGKIYHHGKDDLQGWSREPFRPKGEWKGRGYLAADAIACLQANDAKLAAQGKRSRGVGPAFEAADVPDNAYRDGLNADAAITSLESFGGTGAKAGQPFFLALGMHKPHLPFNAPKRYWDLYDPAKIDLADNPFAPEDMPGYASTSWGELRQYLNIPNEGPVSDDLARRLIHGYCACVSYIDALVGRVLDTLDRLKLRENTIVMLWGDHGWKLGEHGAWSKHTNFELDTHVPLIVRAPGVAAAGVTTDALVEFVDMYPTLCALCGLRTPDHLEGRSFEPVMRNPSHAWKTAAFSQFPRGEGVMGYSMRTDRYRYTEWRDRTRKKVLARELYDHVRDPKENRNIANDPSSAVAVKTLSAAMARGWQGALPH